MNSELKNIQPMKYEVGKKFPLDRYLNRGEITVAILNEGFLDVLVCMHNPSQSERQAFKKGKIAVSLYENSEIPFLIFDFGDGFSFDVSVNIQKLTTEQQEAWLNSEANILNLFLVDSATGNLAAMRMLGIDTNITETVRDICEKQSEQENAAIEQKLSGILAVISTKSMIHNAIKKQIFK